MWIDNQEYLIVLRLDEGEILPDSVQVEMAKNVFTQKINDLKKLSPESVQVKMAENVSAQKINGNYLNIKIDEVGNGKNQSNLSLAELLYRISPPYKVPTEIRCPERKKSYLRETVRIVGKLARRDVRPRGLPLNGMKRFANKLYEQKSKNK